MSPPPITPQRTKYYREHTNLSVNTRVQPCEARNTLPLSPSGYESDIGLQDSYSFPAKVDQLTPTCPHMSSLPLDDINKSQYHAYSHSVHILPSLVYGSTQDSSSAVPVTPQSQRTRAKSPLPPSSPPLASSPISTPSNRIVNIVSSPGPMGPLLEEEEYDALPFVLPSGPYSPNKPDYSYAALVGQAILSSPEHRLTLQEIYDYITIVYPFFKRGEQTWMNSIRHVLSTTACFRKVPRERSVGRTLWAIWDEDLECFKGGGFRKQLCKDIMDGIQAKDASRAKRGRKRSDVDTDATAESRNKRPKKDHGAPLRPAVPAHSPVHHATISSRPLFPPTRPTTHLQPYYESCMPRQPLPGDIIFPPLPSGVGYMRAAEVSNTAASSASSLLSGGNDTNQEITPDPLRETPQPLSPPFSSSASSISIPELTPNRSSSSSPPATSDLDGDCSLSATVGPQSTCSIIASLNRADENLVTSADGGYSRSLLGPVRHWGDSPKTVSHALQPGIMLNFKGDCDNDEPLMHRPKPRKEVEKELTKVWHLVLYTHFLDHPSNPAESGIPIYSQVTSYSCGNDQIF